MILFEEIRKKLIDLSKSEDVDQYQADELLKMSYTAAARECWTHKHMNIIIKHYTAISKHLA